MSKSSSYPPTTRFGWTTGVELDQTDRGVAARDSLAESVRIVHVRTGVTKTPGRLAQNTPNHFPRDCGPETRQRGYKTGTNTFFRVANCFCAFMYTIRGQVRWLLRWLGKCGRACVGAGPLTVPNIKTYAVGRKKYFFDARVTPS